MFSRGPSQRGSTAALAVCAMGLTACTGAGGLTESEAEALLQERFAQANSGTCFLTLAKQRGDGGFTITDGPGSKDCFDQVVKAGFGQRGECRDRDGETPSGTCIDRTVVPAGGARGTAKGFAFACGTLSLVEITSMKKLEDGAVSVTYRREFAAAPVADRFGHCREGQLFMPERGTQTKSLAVQKKSDGSWALRELDPFHVHLL